MSTEVSKIIKNLIRGLDFKKSSQSNLQIEKFKKTLEIELFQKQPQL